MTWPASFFFPHRVQVRDMVRQGGMGSVPGAPRTLIAEVIDERTLVRDKDSREVVSNSRVTVPDNAAVSVGALVTVWPGEPDEREAEVIRIGRDKNDPPLPSHQILWLT